MKTNLYTYILTGFALSALFMSSCRKEKIQPEQADSFIKYYGKGGTQTAGNVALTADGGYILVGTSDSYGNGKDILVVKTDKYGNEEWSKVFGGAGDDEGKYIRVTSDGGYVIAGAKMNTTTGKTDVYAIKMNEGGAVVWEKTYGEADENEYASRIINTTDAATGQGYIIAGTSSGLANATSGVYVLKLKANGDTLWTSVYGNNFSANTGTAIQQVDDDEYYTSATSFNPTPVPPKTPKDMLVTKGRVQANPPSGYTYNSNSNINNTNYSSDIANATDILLDNAATGGALKYILGSTTNGQIYILSTFNSDEHLNFYSFLPETHSSTAVSFNRTSDGGFIIAGSTTATDNTRSNILVIRTNPAGAVTWMKQFGGTGDDYGVSAIEATDKSILVSATIQFGGDGTGANPVMSLIHLNSEGELK